MFLFLIHLVDNLVQKDIPHFTSKQKDTNCYNLEQKASRRSRKLNSGLS